MITCNVYFIQAFFPLFLKGTDSSRVDIFHQKGLSGYTESHEHVVTDNEHALGLMSLFIKVVCICVH